MFFNKLLFASTLCLLVITCSYGKGKTGRQMTEGDNTALKATSMVAPSSTADNSFVATQDKDQIFIDAVKEYYLVGTPIDPDKVYPSTSRFKEYSKGLDYDLLLQSQDPEKVNVNISKTGDTTFRVKWKYPWSDFQYQITLMVVDEDGAWKVDNVIEEKSDITEPCGKPFFDYSKPASFYNVWAE